jgi:RNA polymerase sigma-70 factor (ECF subfamily)
MAPRAPSAIALARELDELLRADRGRLVAALAAQLRDLALAEEALHEAVVSAVEHWGRSGVPDRPQAWLYRVALRKAIDVIRRDQRQRARAQGWAALADEEAAAHDPSQLPDQRLALIFACCHPALEAKTRVALTLRTLCGLSTAQVAAVFLDAEPTMGQRLSRARSKIAAAGIPFSIPDAEDRAPRLASVLTVIYLIYTAGYTRPSDGLDLRAEALFLARLVHLLAPDQPEAEGCLALLLLTDGRANARIGPDGASVPPAEQDRSLWDHGALEEGRGLVLRALSLRAPGPFQIKAAIAACHAETPPDWPQIAALYGALLAYEDTPVIRLSRAVALGEVHGPAAALDAIAPLADSLASFQPFHAVSAEFLARAGHVERAKIVYDDAIMLTEDPADRLFLIKRRARLEAAV